jgi:hypothetical protein
LEATLTALIHGESGVGKSWLGDTVPGPRLILDAEGRARYTPSGPKVFWDPAKEGPPAYDGTWETCIVVIHDFNAMHLVYQWLRSGQHPFVSVVVDSLMEVQKRCVDMIVPGVGKIEWDNYQELLRRVEKLVREYRDLTLIPANGVRTVIFITGSKQNDKDKWVPILQGALRDLLPFYIDVVGWYHIRPEADGVDNRGLLIAKQPGYEAKDGTNRLVSHYGPVIVNPNITELMQLLNGGLAAEGVAA